MKTLSRRTAIRGMGGAAIALPFLEAMRPALAQPRAAPKRVIFMFSSSGSVRKNWRPLTVGANPTPSRILEPLATPELKPYLTALSGMNVDAGGNNTHSGFMATALTAAQVAGAGDNAKATAMSIDFALGKRVKMANPSVPFENLQFGVRATSSSATTADRLFSYRQGAGGAIEGVNAEDNPATMFTRVFSNSTEGGDPADLARLKQVLAQDKSTLDFTVDEFKRLGARLGAADRARIEEHATLMRSLENRLAISTCKKPTLVNPPGANLRVTGDMQMDLLAAAMACDQTRVATLQWSNAESAFNWDSVDPTLKVVSNRGVDLGVKAGVATSWWHGISHIPTSWDPTSADENSRAALEVLTRIQIWLAQRLAYLVQKLKGYTDADGKSVMDNTLIFWTTECAEGDHSSKGMPFTVMGNMGGALKSNIHLAYSGRQHGDVFATIGTAMGFATGFERFGRMGYGTGVMTDWLK